MGIINSIKNIISPTQDEASTSEQVATTTTTGTSSLDPLTGLPLTSSGTISLPSSWIITPQSLTQAEKDELQNLQKERELNDKKAKLNKFKSLSSSVRENILKQIEVSNSIGEINDTYADKTPREIELENRNNYSTWRGLSSTISLDWRAITNKLDQLLEAVSFEELQSAHLEALIEEKLE